MRRSTVGRAPSTERPALLPRLAAVLATALLGFVPGAARAQYAPAPEPAADVGAEAGDGLADGTAPDAPVAPEVEPAPEPGDAPTAGSATPPPEDVTDSSILARTRVVVEVFVGETGPDFVDTPLAEVPVFLHVVSPPHDLVESIPGVSDAEGRARFVREPHPTHEVWVELRGPERRFSDAIPLRDPGRHEITLRTRPTTSDPSTVYASRLITLLEPWEGFVVVQQVWTLHTEGELVYRADTSDPGPGMAARLVRFPVPDDAKGVQVIQPAEGSRVLGSAVFFGGEVRPASDTTSRPTQVILQYSLPLESSSLRLDQPIALPVRAASVILPRTSRHSRHPTLDVTLDVPMCHERGSASADTVCFQEITQDTSGMNVNLGTDVVVARGATIEAGGARLVVDTQGWPWRRPWERWAGGAAFVGGLLFSLGLAAREWRRRGSLGVDRRDAAREAVAYQIATLLRAGTELEAARAQGELLQHEYDDAMAQLHERLGVLYRRRRELNEATPGQPTNESEPPAR